MSRFYEALERAERDRAGQADAAEPVEAPRKEGRPAVSRRAAPADSVRPSWPATEIWQTPDPDAGIDDHLVSLLRPSSAEAERYRSLRHAVEQLRKVDDLTVVAISSPSVEDGKTTTTLNLAGALAHTPGARVLVVELDLRRPSIARQLGLEEHPTLMDALYQGRSLAQIVHPCRPHGLSVVPAGRAVVTPYEVLGSARLGELLDEARREYDYVLLDTPPLVPVADVRLIGQLADGFLLVVTADKTPRRLVEESLRALEGVKVIGVVFNRDRRATGAYYDYSGPGMAFLDAIRGRGIGSCAAVMRQLLRRGGRPGNGLQ
jgi:capsular exopolysaccharide synthesis family protein